MKILVAGDYFPRRRVQEEIDKNNFSFFDEVLPFTRNADYSIVNFEGCIADSNDKPIDKVGPNLSCDKRAMEAIKYAGFDCVTLANNHFYDYGDVGVANTLAACEELGIDHVGGDNSIEKARGVLYKQIGDKVLAIVNVCEKEFSIATVDHGGSAPMELPSVYRAIQQAKRRADYVLVITHGGIEVYSYPTLRMKDTFRFFIDAGADAVVNHHQHCISGYEVYYGKPIFYGLGNFCFDWITASVRWWEEGFLVVIDFDNGSISFEMYPYLQFSDKPKVSFDVSKTDFISRISEINSIINSDDLLEEKFNNWCGSNGFLSIFEPYRNRITRALYSRHLLPSFNDKSKYLQILNMVRCESHQDVLLATLFQAAKK